MRSTRRLYGRGPYLRRLYEPPTKFELEVNVMADLVYLALCVLFFGLTWAFVKLCERV